MPLFFLLLLWLPAACVRPSATEPGGLIQLQSPPVADEALPQPTPTLVKTAVPPAFLASAATVDAVAAANTPVRMITPTPLFPAGMASPPCGLQLPLLPDETAPAASGQALDTSALAAATEAVPDAARPAWEWLVANPHSAALVAYRVGDEASGIFHNADTQVPLASVVKLVHLVAYAEAVASGQLDPTSYVTLATLESYYLPGYDLGAHNRAIAELTEANLVLSDPDRIRLEDVPWMMVRHSANTATDYLHTILGQAQIEQTAVDLNLTRQTAPCTFLGQFLAMSNQTRSGSDRMAITAYLNDPVSYGLEAAWLVDAYRLNESFRLAEQQYHRQERRPSGRDQRYFSHSLNAHGTAREYAVLLARIAQNGLSNPESSFLARRYLEWPMIFPANQDRFSNLGYKNGSLPGILNTAYYAYPLGELTPTVVILFFHDLPGSTYRQWRTTLAHDELARWLLDDPEGIALLRTALRPVP